MSEQNYTALAKIIRKGINERQQFVDALGAVETVMQLENHHKELVEAVATERDTRDNIIDKTAGMFAKKQKELKAFDEKIDKAIEANKARTKKFDEEFEERKDKAVEGLLKVSQEYDVITAKNNVLKVETQELTNKYDKLLKSFEAFKKKTANA